MSQSWTADFNVYAARRGDDRMTVSIDLAARQHAPVTTHPVRLNLRVAMRHKRPDGLRAREELDALGALEERVVPALEQKAEAIFVARLVGQGYTEWLFYVPARRRAQADDPEAAVGDVHPYRLEWVVEDDPKWTEYSDLYPGAYAMQTIQNRLLVTTMKEGGDRIDQPREIEHLAIFPTQDQALAAGASLGGRGFRVGEPRLQDGRWWLRFHRTDHCDGRRPDEFTAEILDVILPLDGEFDGWGSMAVIGPGSGSG